MLQKEVEHTPATKTDSAAAFLASLEEPKLTSLADAGKKPAIEILPPGMPSLATAIAIQKKPVPAAQSSQQQPGQPLALEAPPNTTPAVNGAPLQAEANGTTEDGEAPTPSMESNTNLAAAGENAPATSTTDAEAPEVSSQAPDSQEKPLVPDSQEKPPVPDSQEEPPVPASVEKPQVPVSEEKPQVPEVQVRNVPAIRPMIDPNLFD